MVVFTSTVTRKNDPSVQISFNRFTHESLIFNSFLASAEKFRILPIILGKLRNIVVNN
jgi:hypothetical protein